MLAQFLSDDIHQFHLEIIQRVPITYYLPEDAPVTRVDYLCRLSCEDYISLNTTRALSPTFCQQ